MIVDKDPWPRILKFSKIPKETPANTAIPESHSNIFVHSQLTRLMEFDVENAAQLSGISLKTSACYAYHAFIIISHWHAIHAKRKSLSKNHT